MDLAVGPGAVAGAEPDARVVVGGGEGGSVLIADRAVGIFGEEEAVIAGAAVKGVGIADAAEEAVAAVAAGEAVGAGAPLGGGVGWGARGGGVGGGAGGGGGVGGGGEG